MGTRKNAKFLTPLEKENFVRACVLLKADIVNPGAAANMQYSVWDEFAAVHWMIQHGIAPGGGSVNFAHGGLGAYSFLSWHRYFLFHMEQKLQSKVPGVMIPYWDWTDPSSIMTNTFMGPNGTTGGRVQQGYFAENRPGTGGNTTPLPGWWPATLNGWRLNNMFPTNARGGLKRSIAPAGTTLPTSNDVEELLDKGNYHDFQRAIEAGAGISSGHRLHNDMHRWFGGHMQILEASPLDPFFYMVHANVDRLWAMWQEDGHSNEYPISGGDAQHHRNDIMYPWIGATAGYSTTASVAATVPMPTWVTGPGIKRNGDTLDFRNVYGYTYDILPIMGISLDRTGSMRGLTPDPMVVAAPNTTKWEAAKRGISAFLQDAETAQASGQIYLTAGIKTFRRFGANNEFDPVFAAPFYGLVKTGGNFSKNAFDTNINTILPGGATPLADALKDTETTLVNAPHGGMPVDERRYLAILTDGLSNTGSAMGSIPNGSFNRTAIFAMGFGTGAEVSYTALNEIVSKGRTLTTEQIFHGENAGTIDKFYSNSLAAAIGFTSIFDPVIELFAGEHTHLYFDATSAEDSFLITAQGMDFSDRNWKFMLHGPNGQVLDGADKDHEHASACHACCPAPHITSRRSDGRWTVMVQRGNAPKHCWVGKWELMIAYKAKEMDGMMMQNLGGLMAPVAAGPLRGPRYARLLTDPKEWVAVRNIFTKSRHGLDIQAMSTNRNGNEACNMVINVYARTNLKIELVPKTSLVAQGEEINIKVDLVANMGGVGHLSGLARLVAPSFDIAELVSQRLVDQIVEKQEASIPGKQDPFKKYGAPDRKKNGGEREERKSPKLDPQLDIALILANLEKEGMEFITDSEVAVMSHEGGPLHVHVKDTKIPGTYNFGVYIEGAYAPQAEGGTSDHNGHQTTNANEVGDGEWETFSRLLNVSVGVVRKE